jgi:low affinity Fe/Cu permease
MGGLMWESLKDTPGAVYSMMATGAEGDEAMVQSAKRQKNIETLDQTLAKLEKEAKKAQKKGLIGKSAGDARAYKGLLLAYPSADQQDFIMFLLKNKTPVSEIRSIMEKREIKKLSVEDNKNKAKLDRLMTLYGPTILLPLLGTVKDLDLLEKFLKTAPPKRYSEFAKRYYMLIDKYKDKKKEILAYMEAGIDPDDAAKLLGIEPITKKAFEDVEAENKRKKEEIQNIDKNITETKTTLSALQSVKDQSTDTIDMAQKLQERIAKLEKEKEEKQSELSPEQKQTIIATAQEINKELKNKPAESNIAAAAKKEEIVYRKRETTKRSNSYTKSGMTRSEAEDMAKVGMGPLAGGNSGKDIIFKGEKIPEAKVEYSSEEYNPKKKKVGDWSSRLGEVHSIITKDGQQITPSDKDIVEVSKSPYSNVEKAKELAVQEHVNNSALALKTSNKLNKTVDESSKKFGEMSAVVVNNFNKIIKNTSNVTNAGGGGGGSGKLPLWRDLDSILSGSNI